MIQIFKVIVGPRALYSVVMISDVIFSHKSIFELMIFILRKTGGDRRRTSREEHMNNIVAC
jgi:hypothetical protein